jgi:hypothetical protein
MDWIVGVIEACRSNSLYIYAAERAEIILLAGAVLFFVLKGNVKVALILAFAGVLGYANYYVFSQELYQTMPPIYAGSFAAASAIVLVLLVYQLIHSN